MSFQLVIGASMAWVGPQVFHGPSNRSVVGAVRRRVRVKARGVRVTEGFLAWTISRAAARDVLGCSGHENGGVLHVTAVLAARVVIRTAGGVCGNRAHSEQRHGPRWVGWRSLGARHMEWNALSHSARTRGPFRVRVAHPAHGVPRGGGVGIPTRTNTVGLVELTEVRATRIVLPWQAFAGDVVGWNRTRRPMRWARRGPVSW